MQVTKDLDQYALDELAIVLRFAIIDTCCKVFGPRFQHYTVRIWHICQMFYFLFYYAREKEWIVSHILSATTPSVCLKSPPLLVKTGAVGGAG